MNKLNDQIEDLVHRANFIPFVDPSIQDILCGLAESLKQLAYEVERIRGKIE